jgi:hypothetical protein
VVAAAAVPADPPVELTNSLSESVRLERFLRARGYADDADRVA